MSCHYVPGGLQDLLDDTWGRQPAQSGLPVLPSPSHPTDEAVRQQPTISPYQFSKKVEEAVETYIRPMLQEDGGDMEIIDIKGTLVYCRLEGACAGCAAAGQTLKMMIEKTLKDHVDEQIRVVAV